MNELEQFEACLRRADFSHVSVRHHFGYRYFVYAKRADSPTGCFLMEHSPAPLDNAESAEIVRRVTGTANGRHVYHRDGRLA